MEWYVKRLDGVVSTIITYLFSSRPMIFQTTLGTSRFLKQRKINTCEFFPSLQNSTLPLTIPERRVSDWLHKYYC